MESNAFSLRRCSRKLDSRARVILATDSAFVGGVARGSEAMLKETRHLAKTSPLRLSQLEYCVDILRWSAVFNDRLRWPFCPYSTRMATPQGTKRQAERSMEKCSVCRLKRIKVGSQPPGLGKARVPYQGPLNPNDVLVVNLLHSTSTLASLTHD